jgi:hypothetical protein
MWMEPQNAPRYEYVKSADSTFCECNLIAVRKPASSIKLHGRRGLSVAIEGVALTENHRSADTICHGRAGHEAAGVVATEEMRFTRESEHGC